MIHDLFEGLGIAPADRVLLGCFAHPDDEAFTCGGSLAAIAAVGGRSQLVCATRGEVGEISDAALATAETLGRVREGELREACRILGISAPEFFGYRDSGMAGTPQNEAPEAFVKVDRAEVTGRVVEAIRRHQPQVVLTFDPFGGYGHPDHIAIHHATVDAFAAAADPSRFPEQIAAGLQPHAARRLAFIAIVRSAFVRLGEELAKLGVTPEQSGVPRGAVGLPDELVDVSVDVSAYVDRKLEALFAHRTQMGANSFFHRLPREGLRDVTGRENYVLAAGPGVRAR